MSQLKIAVIIGATRTRALPVRTELAALPETMVAPELLATVKEKNLNAKLGRLNSLKRNVNAYINSKSPKFAAVQAFVVASAEADLAQAAADAANAAVTAEQAELDALNAELGALTGLPPAATPEEQAAREAQIAELNAQITEQQAAVTAAEEAAAQAQAAADEAAEDTDETALQAALTTSRSTTT